MIRGAVIFTALTLASPAQARDPVFNIPLDCTLGQDCYIQKYVDHDPSPAVQDYQCGTLANDGHKGTDFALFDLNAMARGVDVLSAAPGRVRAVRDNMPDISVRDPDAPDITGKECGNGIVVDHGGGWETQYCHLKLGSISVKRGQKVLKGTPMGQVGLSGETEYPHVHLSVRFNGQVVDPFSSDPDFTCANPNPRSLWQKNIDYIGGGLLNVGISTMVPKFSELKQGINSSGEFTTNVPALVAWAYVYGGRNGDIVKIRLLGPSSKVITQEIKINKATALFFRAAGRKQPKGGWPKGGWPKGTYIAELSLIRDGKILAERSISAQVK